MERYTHIYLVKMYLTTHIRIQNSISLPPPSSCSTSPNYLYSSLDAEKGRTLYLILFVSLQPRNAFKEQPLLKFFFMYIIFFKFKNLYMYVCIVIYFFIFFYLFFCRQRVKWKRDMRTVRNDQREKGSEGRTYKPAKGCICQSPATRTRAGGPHGCHSQERGCG